MEVQEWLGNNQLSLDIWSKKYRYKDENFEQWLDRVSGNNSEIKRLIREKKFLFGGRTLANRGIPNSGSFSNCFVAGSKVICKRGLINIEDIVIGDEVLSADGKFHRVNDIMKRKYSGDLYKIESHEIYAPIICTPNHKFLTNWGWKRADRIFPQGVSYTGKGQDMLKTAYFDGDSYFYKAGEGEVVDLTDGYIADDKHRVIYSDDNLASLEIYVNVSPVKDKEHYVWKTFGNPINHKVTLTSDFLYFIGRWIGDGSITCRKGQTNPSILQIVFNATTEQDAAERCQKIGEEIFGISASVTKTKQNVIAVRFESPFISSWFLKNFGEKCDGKFIPDKFLGNRDILCGIIDSDGSLNTHGAVKLVLKNKGLLQWVKDTCYLNGINTGQIKDISYRQEATGQLDISVTQANAKLNKYLMKDYHDKRQNKVARGNSEYIYIPSIEVLEDQECDVYNISVEKDHTYTVNGVIVHNCYSVGFVPDSLEGIMDVATKIAMTFKAQGGQGLSLSQIRPKGSLIAGQFKSDGIVPFMHIFNTVTESISQGGSRKGALMMSIDAWHPEAETFIKIKEDFSKINKANLSVEINDRFMRCINDEEAVSSRLTDIDDEHTIKVNPKHIFNTICESAWKSAEPGILFVDRLRNYNLMEFVDDYQIETTNPCGEQPLPKHGACNLCSINISEYVIDPYTPSARIDYVSLKDDIETIISEMDKVLEENLERHALPEQKEMARKYRNIGCGIMGLADLFVKLGIRYGSADSIGIANYLMRFIFRESVMVNAANGRIYGSFPGYNPKVWDSTIIKNAFDEEEIKELKKQNTLRNCSLLSIAPTGSIGTLLALGGTGCEPFFALSFNRKTDNLNGTYKVELPIIEEYRKVTGNQGELPNYFITSAEIPWKERVDMQAALQEYCDTAISSTVNLPKETTVEDVKDLYKYAWKKGCKGITIYREGSRDPILFTEPKKEDTAVKDFVEFKKVNPVQVDTNEEISEQVSLNTENAKLQLEADHGLKRGEIVKTGDHWLGLKRTLTTGCGTLHCEAFFDPNTGELRECYLSKGSTGGCNNFMIGLSRMISLSARGGISIDAILDQLKSCGTCPSYAVRQATKHDTSKGSCCPVAVGNALRDMHKEIQDIICECKKGNSEVSIEFKPKEETTEMQLVKDWVLPITKLKPGEPVPEGYIALDEIPKKEGQSHIDAFKEYIHNLHEENESLKKRSQEVYEQCTGSYDPKTGKTWAQIFKEREEQKNSSSSLEECPSCHEKTLIHTNGCLSCPSCGWSRCN